MPAIFATRTIAALKFRVPAGRFALAAPVVSAAKWWVLWAAVEAALGWGRHTRFGAGLVGATVPLLVVEAWLTTRWHWRTRLLDTLAFAVPLGALLSLGAVVPGSCCVCDYSPWIKTLRSLELIADFLYFSALATLPASVLLVVLWRRSPSCRERLAYQRTTVAVLLSTLSCAVVFAAFLQVLTCQFDDNDRVGPARPADLGCVRRRRDGGRNREWGTATTTTAKELDSEYVRSIPALRRGESGPKAKALDVRRLDAQEGRSAGGKSVKTFVGLLTYQLAAFDGSPA